MKPHELRIGNYIHTDLGPYQVATISEFYCDLILHNKDGYITTSLKRDDLKPIHLTEKWLEDFGFREEIDGIFVKDATKDPERPIKIIIRMHFADEICISLWDESQEIVVFDGTQYYVHQLQNLYFALTGTELNCPNPCPTATN